MSKEIAAALVKGWRTGARTGDWSGVIALLAADVRITMPFRERWRGEKRGRAEATELFRHAAEDLEIGLDQRPTGPLLGDGGAFAIQLKGCGTVGGKPAEVPICLWFTVAGDRVTRLREYIGDPA